MQLFTIYFITRYYHTNSINGESHSNTFDSNDNSTDNPNNNESFKRGCTGGFLHSKS